MKQIKLADTPEAPPKPKHIFIQEGEMFYDEKHNAAWFVRRGNRFFILPDNRLAGWLTKTDDDERVFVSPRTKDHYFEIFSGWAICRDLLRYLKQIDVKTITLVVNKMPLTTFVETWLANGKEYRKQGFETQLVLNETYFHGAKT